MQSSRHTFLYTALGTALLLAIFGLLTNWRSAITQTTSVPKLYWSDVDTNKIQRANLDGTGIEDVVAVGLSSPDGLAIDGSAGKLYWTDWTINKIQRANLNGTNVEDLITTGILGPDGIALDLAAAKMYWVDWTNDKIQRANLNGTGVEDLITTGLALPETLALDPVGGKLYWTDSGTDKIQRANLDGTAIESLVIIGLLSPQGIALDLQNGKMYWTDAGTNKIQRANLDGTAVESLVTTGLSNPQSIALDLQNGKMYWTNMGVGKIQRANLNGTGIEDVVTGLSAPQSLALALMSNVPTPTFTPTVTPSPTPTATATPTSTHTPQAGQTPTTTVVPLPDLLIETMRIESETNASCGELPTMLGVRLVIRNAGVAAAGAFVITVNSQEQAVPQGLAAGASITVWVAGTVTGETSATVDAANTVVESNESNNTLAQLLPIPTPVPTCTPVGTRYLYLPAVLQMPTPTPTATVTPPTRQWQRLGTPGQDLSALAVTNGWLLAADRGSNRKGLYRASLAQCQTPNFTAAFQNVWSIAPVYDVTAVGNQALAGSEEKEVLYSTDSGATWNKTSSNIEEQIAAVALANGKFYAGSLDDSGKPERTGLFTSADQGQSWQQIPNSPKALNRLVVGQGALWIGTEGQCAYQVQVDTNSLTERCDGLSIKAARQVRDIAIDTSTKLIYLATADGVYRGNGNESWQAFGLQGKSIYSLAVAQQALYAGTATGGVQSRNLATGADWEPILTFTTGTVRDLLFEPAHCNALLAAADDSVWILR